MGEIIPTYSEYIYEAKTLGHEFEQAVLHAIVSHVNKNELYVKPLKVKINTSLIAKYAMIERDIENLFKLFFQEFGSDLLIKKVEFVGSADTPRKFEMTHGKISSPLTPGKDLADILILTNKKPIYLSLKFGTALITLCNIGLRKFKDEQMDDLFDFIGVDRDLFAAGLDDYTAELYKIVKSANEITINDNIKIKPPERISDQKFLYAWLSDILDEHFPDKNVVVGAYTNWIMKIKGKWMSHVKPTYDSNPTKPIDSPNHLSRLMDIVLALLENKVKFYDSVDDMRSELIGTNKTSDLGKIKITDQFFKFIIPPKSKNQFEKPMISNDKLQNYMDLLQWSLGKNDEYFIYFGHLKKNGIVHLYDDKYVNDNLKISSVSITTMPSSLTKSLIIKIETNSQDEYNLNIRNKEGGINPQVLTINLRKKW